MTIVEDLLLIPVAVGSVYAATTLLAVLLFARRGEARGFPASALPGVTILKPVHGLERGLERNLRSACEQDYPEYQVVFCVQRLDDPALPLLRRLENEYGQARVTVAAEASEPLLNGKIQNLQIGFRAARHDVLVVSDSDVFTPPDYLRAMVAPLADPDVGYVTSLYRGACARRWYEKLELLTYNADFIPSVVFAHQTGTSGFCLGASVALRRETLQVVGGLSSLADYLVEDYELGRRILARGQRMRLAPYFVDLTVDLSGPGEWWRHQLYWDQNTRAAHPVGFTASVLTRLLPFALLFAASRLFDPVGLIVLAGALVMRTATAAATLAAMGDGVGLRALWLLPVRDLAGFVSWFVALRKRTFTWRGHEFGLTRDGRIVPRSP
ncbi:MAG: glycosyltransferase [Gammaproteobacteria bacterium]|nr:glycosyltransferase [Gammaproteobacteria bacterium]NIR85757.1 glycosyltransferase [Gammaproteobacteria bacterium]NIR90290.1 glycosyltransferase [Gammaproteobacteria bacterium]NIU06891.1 glycosyltransferase [Gammaproteobacteria bacterium]NIV53824.1 glycosyltransferase [Gammaproteobacteria bacterium]